jgi:hypothetical protein
MAGASAAGLAAGRAAAAQDAAADLLPTIALGKHRVTRLVVGSNPINGYSYLGHHMDRHMKEYFTVERAVEFLRQCEEAGINTHQFSTSEKTPEILRRAREGGSRMHFIGLHSGRAGVKAVVSGLQPIAMVHHGGVTDRLFAEGKSQEVRDYVKEVHDQGILAGVSAHNPECIRRIADEGWEADFFMACFYHITRKGEPAAGPATLQISYPFYADDPAAMTKVVRQVKQPCLGFKILGAGRKCASPQTVRAAFRFAFENIKPTDGVIVGLYPRFADEIAEDVKYTREFAKGA